VILYVVLYGCETWSITLREERRLRVLENRVLRRIFGPKMDDAKVSGDNYTMRKLIILFLTQFYSGDQCKDNEMGGACSTFGRHCGCIHGLDGET
jgi:hypothetical protein